MVDSSETERKERMDTSSLMEQILSSDNLNRAYLQVVRNKGAEGVDGMKYTELKEHLAENGETIKEQLRTRKYKPQPVRRVEIPKPDGGFRNQGVPTVADRFVQQAIAQVLTPIYEEQFHDHSYGFRPNRCAQQAILTALDMMNDGNDWIVDIDLEKFFDTVNHDKLMTIIGRTIKDGDVISIIRKYLVSGIMIDDEYEDSIIGTPQGGGNLSPLLANIYLNEFDQEFVKRGVPCIRYADDIVLLAKSKRASERLLESSTKYLEEKLKLTVNREKSRTVSVFAIRNFKFLGFALGRNGSGIYVRVHPKSWKKFKTKLKTLSSRKKCQSIKPSLEEIKVYARGWLNYYGIASMKRNIEDINGWLYHRIRMCIWKQWKKPKTKIRNLLKMGVPMELAWQAGNSRRGYWFTTQTVAVNMAMTKERLINSGFYDLATAYQSVHVNY